MTAYYNESDMCWGCGGVGSWHDCGEDTCCCLEPEDDTYCDICQGEGVLPSDDEEDQRRTATPAEKILAALERDEKIRAQATKGEK